jgi:hypothetical protein
MLNLLKGEPALFDLFARREEYRSGLRDSFGRFPYYMSEHRNVFDPSVSRFLHEQGMRFEYPEGRRFAVMLSHDVDTLCRTNYFRKELDSARSLMAGDPRGCLNHLRSPRVARQFLDTREIMALEAEYGACSSFYFLAVEPGDPDRTYDIMDLRDDLRYVLDSGWEIGLHGSQRAHADLATMIKEREKVEAAVGAPISGYRNHFLRFSTPLTWRLLQQAGFKYDTTLGYADCAGFRNGMCHPFKPFDLEIGTTIDIIEFPLMIMDASLFYNHMRLDASTAWEKVKEMIDTVEKLNGMLTILWHNTYMRGEHLKIYTKILDYCRERKAWMPTGKDLRDHAAAALDG